MKIENYIQENYPDHKDKILLADGFEDAFMGVVESFGSAPKALYDYHKCVDVLMKRDDMGENDAHEYMSFNVTQAYVGEYTPAFISYLRDGSGEDFVCHHLYWNQWKLTDFTKE